MADLPLLLVIGVGSIGERHLRCFQATGRVRCAIVEPNDRLRNEIAKRYEISQPYDSLDSAIEAIRHEKVPVRLAVIATPAPFHVSQAIRLLQSEWSVLIEKPLSVTDDGIAELQSVAKNSPATTAVAYVYRAHPALTQMRAAIRNGDFGTPLELIAVSGQHFPFYRPAYAQTYYARHDQGGGAVQDALTHVVNMAEWLVGPITSLVADVDRQRLETTDVEDTVHVLARHGHVMASYSLNQHQAPNESTVTIVCERGTARFEFHENRWLSCREPGQAWDVHDAKPLERDSLFTIQANQFLDSCLNDVPPNCTLDEAVTTFRVNRAILNSAKDQSWIHLDGDTI